MSTVQFLLSVGQDPKQLDSFGASALDVASSSAALACLRLLRRHVARWRKVPNRRSRDVKNLSHKSHRYKDVGQTATSRGFTQLCKNGMESTCSTNMETSASKVASSINRPTTDKKHLAWGDSNAKSAWVDENTTFSWDDPNYKGSDGVSTAAQSLYERSKVSSTWDDSNQARSHSASSCYHSECSRRKPFIAFRVVPVEEKNLVTVAYTELKSPVVTEQRKPVRNTLRMTKERSNIRSHCHKTPAYYQTQYHKQFTEEIEYTER